MRNPLVKIIRLVVILLLIVTACAATILVNEFINSRKITDTDALSGQRIGVMSGWESDYYLSNRSDLTLKRYDTTADLFLALGYHQIDAAALDKVSIALAMASIDGITTVGKPLVKTNYTIEVKRGDAKLLKEFNDFFAYFKESDEYAEFCEHYFDIDWINNGEMTKATGTGEKLVVGCAFAYYPFEFITAEGEVRGNEIELINRFANYYNYQLEFVHVTDETYMMDIKTGKVDVLLVSSNDMYRRETETVTSPVDMSDGYISSDVYCVVLDGEMKVKNEDFYNMSD